MINKREGRNDGRKTCMVKQMKKKRKKKKERK